MMINALTSLAKIDNITVDCNCINGNFAYCGYCLGVGILLVDSIRTCQVSSKLIGITMGTKDKSCKLKLLYSNSVHLQPLWFLFG